MKKFPIVLDLETKYSFRDFDDPQKLGITVVGIYDYKDSQQKIFEEKELNKLFPILEAASYIIGYNVVNFDIPVLQAYYPGKVEVFQAFDILDYIKQKIGRRISLNEVIGATLGKKKTGHGLQAIDLYNEGKIDELKKYCLDDVMLTKELFEYGVKNMEIFYLTPNGKLAIEVDWKKYLESQEAKDMPLTLPF
ncbi:ribonuclease H-like domain-containing protein [Candidatus Roizmanbacteria bacterium]|nr:ribonuclease H-like domain-containing protein [Candidatus Roizmanbacteria bacterium]